MTGDAQTDSDLPEDPSSTVEPTVESESETPLSGAALIAAAMADSTEAVGIAVGPRTGISLRVPLSLRSDAGQPLLELLFEDATTLLGAEAVAGGLPDHDRRRG